MTRRLHALGLEVDARIRVRRADTTPAAPAVPIAPQQPLRAVAEPAVPSGTPRRSVRVPDDLWDAAMAAAARRGIELSTHIRRGLVELVEQTDSLPSSPQRPLVASVRDMDQHMQAMAVHQQGVLFG